MTLSLHTIPVELVYRILDNLEELTILLSLRNVCTRLNAITDTYHRYQVSFNFIPNFTVLHRTYKKNRFTRNDILFFSVEMLFVGKINSSRVSDDIRYLA
jgi:hypothetical protein